MRLKPDRPIRACAYLRVSTDDQALHGISIPSQRRKIEEFCAAKGWELVEILEEPGQSGKDEGRPIFRKMMGRAVSAARPFDVIVVYAMSRFARNLGLQTISFEQLRDAGVELASVTESFGKGPNANLMRSMVGALNQHLSDQSSVNTIRAMNENAVEGFWNGGPVPVGYRSVTVEQRGNKQKKKLAIHEPEAEIVRKVFRLAREGDGKGPLGARAIAQWLNQRSITLRGSRFFNSNVSGILSRTHYCGYYLDGKRNEYKELLPEDQWIRVSCPPIISEEDFLEVAALRAKRSPKVTPPRVTNGVTLLPAAVARCGQPSCQAGLTVISGKGGRYHYYRCSARANSASTACDLPSIRRDALDEMVLDALMTRVLQPSRLKIILQHLLERSETANQRRRKDLAVARAELTTTGKAVTNLMMAIESGAFRPDEPAFIERMAQHRARKSALEAEIHSLEGQLATARLKVDEKMIAEFGRRLGRALREGDNAFRTAYVRLFVDRVIVFADEIRIEGSKVALERALVSVDDPNVLPVPSLDREWCPGEDSNLHAVSSAAT